MRITLLLCLFVQFIFPSSGNKIALEAFHTELPPHSTLTTWSLNDVLSLYSSAIVQEDAVKVHPNPIYRREMLNISTQEEGKKLLAFYDITGNLVKQFETDKKTISFNISDFASGIYILNVSSQNFKATKKIIVK